MLKFSIAFKIWGSCRIFSAKIIREAGLKYL